MRRILLIWMIISLANSSFAQRTNGMIDGDSLLLDIAKAPEDSSKVILLRVTAEYYIGSNIDSALYFAQQALDLSNKIDYEKGKIISQFTMGKIFVNMGNYTRGLDLYLEVLKISEQTNNIEWQLYSLNYIGDVYALMSDYPQSLAYYFKSKSLAERNNMNFVLARIEMNIGKVYEKLNKLDSAGIYLEESYVLVKKYNDDDYMPGKILYSLGALYTKKADYTKALDFFRLSELESDSVHDFVFTANAALGLANVYDKLGKKDSSLYYARQSLKIAKQAGFIQQQLDAVIFLSRYFQEQKIFDSAYAYMEATIAIKDSLINTEKIREFEKITFSEQFRQQDIKQAQLKYDNKIRVIIFLTVLIALLIVAIVLWRNVWNKQRANRLLLKQKVEIDKQKDEIESSYKELKLTQEQLIQSEKMASLGELTAGIAHEIQNPLNFVNNFSEVSSELVNEMIDEVNKGNYDEAKSIAEDVKQNLGKIDHHGKRADAIVKGMLQHSRASSGQKEPTDINLLADEYLRLSYHGLRAKDKSFNAKFETHLDPALGKINVVPQDIGRVILNLINNAFYAVTEKKNAMHNAGNTTEYMPVVSVTTKKLNDKVEIKVHDNGSGIPKKVLDKIFQPFFTTKPTGQGTGLGLSLSYDIIKKGHNGELKVETNEQDGTTFIILLPG